MLARPNVLNTWHGILYLKILVYTFLYENYILKYAHAFTYKKILQVKKQFKIKRFWIPLTLICLLQLYWLPLMHHKRSLHWLLATGYCFKLPPMAFLSPAAWASQPGVINSSTLPPPLAPSRPERAFSRPEAAQRTTVQVMVSNGILKHACANSVSACERKSTDVFEWERLILL